MAVDCFSKMNNLKYILSGVASFFINIKVSSHLILINHACFSLNFFIHQFFNIAFNCLKNALVLIYLTQLILSLQ